MAFDKRVIFLLVLAAFLLLLPGMTPQDTDEEETTAAEGEAGETTVADEGETGDTPGAEGETTAAEGETTAAEGETTAAEGETTAAEGETTAAEGETEVTVITGIMPGENTTEIVENTTPAEEETETEETTVADEGETGETAEAEEEAEDSGTTGKPVANVMTESESSEKDLRELVVSILLLIKKISSSDESAKSQLITQAEEILGSLGGNAESLSGQIEEDQIAPEENIPPGGRPEEMPEDGSPGGQEEVEAFQKFIQTIVAFIEKLKSYEKFDDQEEEKGGDLIAPEDYIPPQERPGAIKDQNVPEPYIPPFEHPEKMPEGSECGPNEEFKKCSYLCQPSCRRPRIPKNCPYVCGNICVCRKPLVRRESDNKCIPRSRCPPRKPCYRKKKMCSKKKYQHLYRNKV